MKILGHLVDIHNREIYPATINVLNGVIDKIERVPEAPVKFIMPGLIDSHIHIESSMITPGAFAMTAVRHGTTGVVSDPHEIANVLGLKGVKFMINDGEKVPLKFWFGAPSCVPATGFETNGETLNHNEIEKLLKLDDILFLSEMMNFPGVIYDDKEVLKKIDIAKKLHKPIDGHAPGLKGDMLRKYVEAGISTDHECSTEEEALEKISLGMKILIREGSAARNLDSLKNLFNTYPEMIMLCSDDLHPEMLVKGHINRIVAKLISEGFNVFDVIRCATINPVTHYGLDAGLLQEGQSADFIVVDSLRNMNVLETWINGEKVYADGKTLFSYSPGESINNFKCSTITEKDIVVENKSGKIRVIEAIDGELLTNELIISAGTDNILEPDTDKDILKIIVINRYIDSTPVVGFIKGFGMKKGALASSVAHDSHNIISIGTNDKDIVNSVNEIIKKKGGLAVSSEEKVDSLQLDIAGIMTTRSCEDVASDYLILSEKVKSLGCRMSTPFMTLSFMALLVIPDLKIGDKGLFDVKRFELVPLFVK
ncbi:MAG: adenine deaminase [Bacteroidales bacterium]|nr:adenine deaminase [Bacteroidales bacterium]